MKNSGGAGSIIPLVFLLTYIFTGTPCAVTGLDHKPATPSDNNDALVHNLKVCQVQSKINPDQAQSWFNLSDKYSALHQYQEAIPALTRSLRLLEASLSDKKINSAEKEWIKDEMVIVLKKRSAFYDALGDKQQMRADLVAAKNIDPLSRDPFSRAVARPGKRPLDRSASGAEATYKNDKRPASDRYLDFIARCQRASAVARYEPAIDLESQAIALYPKCLLPYYLRAHDLRRIGNLTLALRDYATLLKLSSGDQLLRAEEQSLLKVSRAHPVSDQSLLFTQEQAQSAYKLRPSIERDAHEQLQIISSFRGKYPLDIRGFAALANYNSLHKNYPAAIAALEEAYVIDPFNLDTFESLASLYYGTGSWQKAAKFYTLKLEQYVPLSHQLLPIYAHKILLSQRADCYTKCHQILKAKADYASVLEFDRYSKDL